MSQRFQFRLTDQLSDGEAWERVSFSIDGRAYEIELSSSNAQQLREFLDHFAEASDEFAVSARPADLSPAERDLLTLELPDADELSTPPETGQSGSEVLSLTLDGRPCTLRLALQDAARVRAGLAQLLGQATPVR